MIRMSPDLFCSGLGTFLLELIQTMIKYLFCTVAAILVFSDRMRQERKHPTKYIL